MDYKISDGLREAVAAYVAIASVEIEKATAVAEARHPKKSSLAQDLAEGLEAQTLANIQSPEAGPAGNIEPEDIARVQQEHDEQRAHLVTLSIRQLMSTDPTKEKSALVLAKDRIEDIFFADNPAFSPEAVKEARKTSFVAGEGIIRERYAILNVLIDAAMEEKEIARDVRQWMRFGSAHGVSGAGS